MGVKVNVGRVAKIVCKLVGMKYLNGCENVYDYLM